MGYSLGIDLSTQSLSICVYDIEQLKIIYELSAPYIILEEIQNSKMDVNTLLIPQNEGQAEQDPYIFLVALDHIFENLAKQIDISKIVVIQISAQQHGHVYLNQQFSSMVQKLHPSKTLWGNLKECFSYQGAPIWRSTDTKKEVLALRNSVGGKKEIIDITGSNSPLRFTGAIIKKIVSTDLEAYKNTHQIQLLNTFLAAILSGNYNPDVDWGNASGTSLMNYEEKTWSDILMNEVSTDVSQKLGKLSSPLSKAGNIQEYFITRYGFSKECVVGIGTGDNPATKVLAEGDLLSLGTSFVYMLNINKTQRDYTGTSNAMYDGLGDPFMILCRTNGAMVWDKLRAIYQKDLNDSYKGLLAQKGQYPLKIWQIENESVPLSVKIPFTQENNLEEEYKGIVLSSLGLLALYTEKLGMSSKLLSVTGGATRDLEIVQIIANLWNMPVSILPTVGAALGAALMGGIMIDNNFPLDLIRTNMSTQIIQPEYSEQNNIINYKKELQLAISQYLIGK